MGAGVLSSVGKCADFYTTANGSKCRSRRFNCSFCDAEWVGTNRTPMAQGWSIDRWCYQQHLPAIERAIVGQWELFDGCEQRVWHCEFEFGSSHCSSAACHHESATKCHGARRQ